jgi:hypothetical protein
MVMLTSPGAPPATEAFMITPVLLVTLFGAGPPVEPDAYPAPDRRESYLREQLWGFSREVDLGGAKAVLALHGESVEAVKDAEAGKARSLSLPLRRLAAGRDDLRGLRFLPDGEAELSPTARDVLYNVSSQMKDLSRGHGYGAGAEDRMAAMFTSVVAVEGQRGELAGPRLEQVAMPHGWQTRQALIVALSGRRSERDRHRNPFYLGGWVVELGSIGPGVARRTIARRAVFDPSQEVRRAARWALRGGDPTDVRPIFLAALRHPWPPAADHAARALVQIEDTGALPELRKLVKLPPPDEPRREGGRWVRRGVARIDHLRNCMLCHPAAGHNPPRSAVLGTLQLPGRALNAGPQHVYAHVAFLRPDLSIPFEVKAVEHDTWPANRRFDFVEAEQTMTDAEHKEYLARRAESLWGTYPQREAVRWAITKLSR